jgi:predicted Zn-dependent protease with MMP-like domain
MKRSERDHFDRLLEQVVADLPQELKAMIDEVPVVVEDHPSPALLRELGIDPEEDGLCGLHSGVPLTDRSVSQPSLPDVVTLFREGIVEEAGGWTPWIDDEGVAQGGQDAVVHEIRITLLHEVGHHFGLDEDDLSRLGYG